MQFGDRDKRLQFNNVRKLRVGVVADYADRRISSFAFEILLASEKIAKPIYCTFFPSSPHIRLYSNIARGGPPYWRASR